MPANLWFTRELRTALISLYDPVTLRASPLTELFDPGQRSDPVSILRRTLLDGVESLRPTRDTPQGSRAWRVYQILRRRYTEGLSQRQVAGDLGLSIRQLQREEKLAREMLADHLWLAYHLEENALQVAAAEPDEDQETVEEAPVQSVQEELEWLRSSVPLQLTDVGELIQEVLETVEPLMALPEITAVVQPEGERHVALRAAIVRQALLDILSTAIRYAQDGRLHIQTELPPQQVLIRVSAYPGREPFGRGHTQANLQSESLAMAAQLIQLCNGSLHWDTAHGAPPELGAKFTATIVLPAPEQTLVLVVDDNADALQLAQRYLSNTRYLFIGTQDAARGLELAAELGPAAVLLDVMMPGRDGWTLLGQLREHPKTGHIPVIVCTILSQRELALALGAAGFIRKPVKRAELLSMLGQLVAPSSESPSP